MRIEARSITKSFGNKNVLNDFSHIFESGTVTAVMGPSGCGKSTLLSILMGVLNADSGKILHEKPLKRSAVFQENRLCENLTSSANIRLVTGKRLSSADIHKELAAVALADCADKPVRELSGGMKRRVALLRALLCDYDVLFLDEPFKGLDDDTKRIVMDYTKAKTAGKTVIMVTHDIAECNVLADNIVTLKFQ